MGKWTTTVTLLMLLGWATACGPDPDAPEPTEPVVPEATAGAEEAR